MRMNFDERCISNLTFDEWAAKELAPEHVEQLQSHLAECDSCQSRYAGLEYERSSFLKEAPSWHAYRQRFTKHRATRRGARQLGWAAIAVAALVMWFVVPHTQNLDVTRRKGGGPHLGFFIKRGERVNRGASGDLLMAGDRLRFTYTSKYSTCFALLSRDSQTATIYYPSTSQCAHIPAGNDVPLDFSVELDETPGNERIFALFCARPIALESLRVELAGSGRLGPVSDCQIDSVLLQKESRR
jgi:hypothetical protein